MIHQVEELRAELQHAAFAKDVELRVLAEGETLNSAGGKGPS